MTPLTDKEIADIDDALDKKKDPGEVLGKRNAVDLTRKDVMTMGEGQRLNDEVLNFSLDVLLSKTKGDADGQNRFHIFNTFFYEKLTEEGGLESVKRWTRENKLKYDILTCEKIFVPVHVGCRKLGHWFLVVVNLREMTVNVWDSIGGTNEKEAKNIHQWIVEEYREKKNRKVEFRVRRAENIPRQNNLVDCGVFMYQYVERTVMGCPLNFSHQDIPHLRRRMIANALKEKPITDN